MEKSEREYKIKVFKIIKMLKQWIEKNDERKTKDDGNL